MMDMPMSSEGCFSTVDESLSPSIDIKALPQLLASYHGLPINPQVWIGWNHNAELQSIAPSISPHATQLKVESPATGMMSPPPRVTPADPPTGSQQMNIDASMDFQDDIEEPLFPEPLPTPQELSMRAHGVGLPTYNDHSWASPQAMTRNSSSATSQSQLSHQQFYYGTLPSTESINPHAITMPSQNSSSLSSPSDSLLNSTSPQGMQLRKRKSSPLTEDEDDAEAEEPETPDPAPRPPVKKTAHNMIEKRYRTNLNDKISALKQSVPALRATEKSLSGKGGKKGMDAMEDLDGLIPPNKLNKVRSPLLPRGIALIRAQATILAKAVEYIGHLERRNQTLINEKKALNDRINTFENLIIGRKAASQQMFTPDQLLLQHNPMVDNSLPDGQTDRRSSRGQAPR
jgi:hypothetical protein